MSSQKGKGFRKEGDGGEGKKEGKTDAQKELRLFGKRELTEFWGKLGAFCEKLGLFAFTSKS